MPGAPEELYAYRAKLESPRDVYDGDTVRLTVDLGFHVALSRAKLRLYGIDAPEVRGPARRDGLAARMALRELLAGAQDIRIRTLKDKQGKFGRWLVIIYADGVNVNRWLVEKGFAVWRKY